MNNNSIFAEAAQQFIDVRTIQVPVGSRVRYVSPRTLDDYATFRKALNVFFEKLPLGQIEWPALHEYQRLRAMGGDERLKWAAPAGANLINKEIEFLIRIMRSAGTWTADHEQNFMRLQTIESDIGYALTPEEQEHWFRTAEHENQFIYRYSILAIHTMMRTNELRAIRLGDANLYSRIVQVRSINSKNKFSIRTIPLTDEAFWALEWLLDRARVLGATLPQHFLFPFGTKVKDPTRPMTVSGIKKPWAQVCEASGIKWRPYDTRHTGCTRAAESGASIQTIMSIAGHMSRKMQDHYTHISDQAKKKMLQDAFGKRPPRGVGRASQRVLDLANPHG